VVGVAAGTRRIEDRAVSMAGGVPMGGRPSLRTGFGVSAEKAAAMANHASTHTTQLYDRRRDELSLDEVERIVI
jgi:hypothetical protein